MSAELLAEGRRLLEACNYSPNHPNAKDAEKWLRENSLALFHYADCLETKCDAEMQRPGKISTAVTTSSLRTTPERIEVLEELSECELKQSQEACSIWESHQHMNRSKAIDAILADLREITVFLSEAFSDWRFFQQLMREQRQREDALGEPVRKTNANDQ